MKLRILVYHSVSADSFYQDLNESNIALDTFKQQMVYLKKTSKKIVTLPEGINGLKQALTMLLPSAFIGVITAIMIYFIARRLGAGPFS